MNLKDEKTQEQFFTLEEKINKGKYIKTMFDSLKQDTKEVSSLEKLSKELSTYCKMANEPSAHLNFAIVEYIRSGMTQTDKFLGDLESIATKLQITLDPSSLEEVDYCCLHLNYALVLFYTKQYRKVLELVDKIISLYGVSLGESSSFVDSSDWEICKEALCLRIESLLYLGQPLDAAKTVGELENLLTKDGEKDEGKYLRLKLHNYRLRTTMLSKSSQICKKDLKKFQTSENQHSKNDALVTQFLKVQHEYFKNQTSLDLFRNSPKVPDDWFTRTGEDPIVFQENNRGCVAFSKHMFIRALSQFQFAYRLNLSSTRSLHRDNPRTDLRESLSGPTLPVLSSSRHAEILYNIGVTLLHCNRVEDSFQTLLSIVPSFPKNPRLWLRIAECCIQHDRLKEKNELSRDGSNVVKLSIGSGIHRKIVLGQSYRQRRKSKGNISMTEPSLEFSSLALKNALWCLPSTEKLESMIEEDAKCMATWHAPPSSLLRLREIVSTFCSVRLSLSYVSLLLNDYHSAKFQASQVLQLDQRFPILSPAQKILAGSYQAQAVAGLDDYVGAIELFGSVKAAIPNHGFISTIPQSLEKAASDLGLAKPVTPTHAWSPTSVAQMKGFLNYNISVCEALREQYAKSEENLSSALKLLDGTEKPSQLYALKLYLLLVEGKRQLALDLLEDKYPHILKKEEGIKLSCA